MATRMCPRCKTENDVARSNCQSCGGVMLGVGAALGAVQGSPVESALAQAGSNRAVQPSPVQTSDVESEIAAALRAKLATMDNLSAEKRARIEAMLQQRAVVAQARADGRALVGPQPVTPGRAIGTVLFAAVLVVCLGVGGFVYVRTQTRVQKVLADVAASQPQPPPAAPVVVPAALAVALTVTQAELEAAQNAAATAAVQPDGEALAPAQLAIFRACFDKSNPPVSFDLTVDATGRRFKVQPLDGAPLPKPFYPCLKRVLPAAQLAPGFWHARWSDLRD